MPCKKPNKWIQGAAIKKGALHKQLGYPSEAHLPEGLVRDISQANIGTHVRGFKVTSLLKKRAVFAMNARKWR